MFRRGAGASVDDLDAVEDVLARWIDAEARGDAAALAHLLDGEFRGDGPRGFVLTKEQWLDRHRSGELVVGAFEWQDVRVRAYDDTAVVMGVQVQTAAYRGEDCSGRYRATLVALCRNGGWSLVNLQLSALTGGLAAGREVDG